ncbi:hypothetical protein T4A_13426 [Trichinella pseudospiralis]|uniref:Uncharacterized protein n=1 Tax=Trichinella pseudospiralis TaxID=6337 RepID=A0A0V1DWK2_TRIPS|nr:hypothetical protein T4A_13426 [Trichinella pseudospiralis]
MPALSAADSWIHDIHNSWNCTQRLTAAMSAMQTLCLFWQHLRKYSDKTTKKVFQMSSCWTSGQKLYNEDSEELRGSQNLRQQLGIVSEHMNC